MCLALLFFVILMTRPAAVFGQDVGFYQPYYDAADFSLAANSIKPKQAYFIEAFIPSTKASFQLGNAIYNLSSLEANTKFSKFYLRP